MNPTDEQWQEVRTWLSTHPISGQALTKKYCIKHHAPVPLLCRFFGIEDEKEYNTIECLNLAFTHQNWKAFEWLKSRGWCSDVEYMKSVLRTKIVYIHHMNKYLELGVDINKHDENGRSIVHHAVQSDKRMVLRRFIEHDKTCVNLPDIYGKVPLLYARVSEPFLTLRLLVENGADVNACRLLHRLAGHQDTSKKLIRFLVRTVGADVFAKNRQGWRPSQVSADHVIHGTFLRYEASAILAVLLSAWVARVGHKSRLTILSKDIVRRLQRYIM
jgi:hypothetical protein